MPSAGRVLVVEDHETERRAISQILKGEGFTVFGSENADKAIGYIDEHIDIVLSDLNMGDVSGMDLLQLWKKSPAGYPVHPCQRPGHRLQCSRGHEKRGVRLSHQTHQCG